MARQRRVVGLQIQLQIPKQTILTQKIEAGGGIGVVLVLGRLFWLGLNIELAFEPDCFFVLDYHMQELSQMVQFPLEVGIPKSAVALASSPKHIACPLKFMSHFDGFFHLRGGISKGVGIAAGCRAVHESWMSKQASRPPEQPYSRALLLFLENLGDGIQVAVGLLQVFPLRGYVPVVKCIKRSHEFLQKL